MTVDTKQARKRIVWY